MRPTGLEYFKVSELNAEDLKKLMLHAFKENLPVFISTKQRRHGTTRQCYGVEGRDWNCRVIGPANYLKLSHDTKMDTLELHFDDGVWLNSKNYELESIHVLKKDGTILYSIPGESSWMACDEDIYKMLTQPQEKMVHAFSHSPKKTQNTVSAFISIDTGGR